MNYPMAKNNFQVQWGGINIGFMEVSGLAIEIDVIPYREGSSKESSETLLPGQKRYTPIVLKRGIIKNDDEFYKWINTAQFNAIERRDVTISLLNENHEPVIVWKIKNAFPSKLEYSPLYSRGSDVAIESLTLVHEGLTVEYL